MSQPPNDSKPKGIMKQDDGSQRRLPRKSISFKDQVTVHQEHNRYSPFEFSSNKQSEQRPAVAQEARGEQVGSTSNNPAPRTQQEQNMHQTNDVRQIELRPTGEAPARRIISVYDDVPDLCDEIRQRVEMVAKMKSTVASLNPNLPVSAPKILPQRPPEPVFVQQERPPVQQLPPGRRLSGAFLRGLREARPTMNVEEIREIKQQMAGLDDRPSNNKERMIRLTETKEELQKQRQTKGFKELYEMFSGIEDKSASKSPREESKIQEPPVQKQPSRVTVGLKEMEKMLLAEDDDADARFERDFSFKKVEEDPLLQKYINPRSNSKSPPPRTEPPQPQAGVELTFEQKRMRLVAYLEKMISEGGWSNKPDSQRLRRRKEAIQKKRHDLNKKIADLRDQLGVGQRQGKQKAENIDKMKRELKNSSEHIETYRGLKLLIGVDHLYFYSEAQLRAKDSNGERIEYYAEFSFGHVIYIKIKKKVGKEPEIRCASSVMLENQTSVLCAKNISYIIKHGFLKNCSTTNMLQTIALLRNQYRGLVKLREQLAYLKDAVDLSSTNLAPTYDRLTLIIQSRRKEADLEVRIDVDKVEWWRHVKCNMMGYSEQLEMLLAGCRLNSDYLESMVKQLSRKLI